MSATGTILLEKNAFFKARGPAKIIINKGHACVMGFEKEAPVEIIVPADRTIIIRGISDKVEIKSITGSMNSFSKIVSPNEQVILDKWFKTATLLAEDKLDSIIVLGETDSGKSTFLSLLANTILQFKKENPLVFDTDIGQSEIAYPTTLGSGIVGKDYGYQYVMNISNHKLAYIGHVTPQPVAEKYLARLALLEKLWRNEKRGPLLINTDGWIYGEDATRIKKAIIEILGVKAAVFIRGSRGFNKELFDYCRKICDSVYVLEPPPEIRKKTREERKAYRNRLFYRIFADARVHEFSFDEVSILNSKILGKSIEQCTNAVQAQRFARGLNRRAKGVLVGLLSSNLELLSLGIIEGIDYEKSIVRIRSPINTSNRVKYLEIGYIRLGDNYAELEHYTSPPI